MFGQDFQDKSKAVTHGLTCMMVGVALAGGFVKGVQPELGTFLAAGFLGASGVAFICSSRVSKEKVESAERWALWFLFGAIATIIAKVCS
jgi:hypothetical protein